MSSAIAQVCLEASTDVYLPRHARRRMLPGSHDSWLYVSAESNDTTAVYKSSTALEMIVAFRGTSNLRDVLQWSNIAFRSDDQVSRYQDGLAYFERLRRRHPAIRNWICTGHSMGALIARYVAARTHTKAIVFAEPVIPTKKQPNNPVPTDSYMVEGDAVGKFGSTRDRILLPKQSGSACKRATSTGPWTALGTALAAAAAGPLAAAAVNRTLSALAAHRLNTYRACLKK